MLTIIVTHTYTHTHTYTEKKARDKHHDVKALFKEFTSVQDDLEGLNRSLAVVHGVEKYLELARLVEARSTEVWQSGAKVSCCFDARTRRTCQDIVRAPLCSCV